MNITANRTLRPGLLVALKTSVTGNRMTDTTILELTPSRRHSETVSTIEDPEEHARAMQTRGKVRSIIRSVCAQSAFGFLCPLERKDRLDAALAEANKVVAEFNASSKLSRVWYGVMIGEVAANDFQAIRAINSEVRDLINEMGAGITSNDAAAARDAAQRAQQVAQMLQAEAQALVDEAVEATRKAARAIVKSDKDKTPEKLDVANETIAASVKVLEAKRGAFLDFDVVEAKIGSQPVRVNLDLGA
jgi:hypothetical protein